MFVQYYTHVPVALAVVEARIDEVRSHLEDWAGVAYRDGEELYATVGPGPGGYAKRVRLEIGTAEIRRTGVHYPITWTAVGAKRLFPKLTADLILSHLGQEKTKLVLQGTYEPPLGAIGRAVDRTLLRNVAESTVQDWVDRVAMSVSSTEPVS
jgi:hypothetical protein